VFKYLISVVVLHYLVKFINYYGYDEMSEEPPTFITAGHWSVFLPGETRDRVGHEMRFWRDENVRKSPSN